jgi:hypothetical protein
VINVTTRSGCITTGQGITWIGNIDRNDHYQALLTWAVQSKTAGALAHCHASSATNCSLRLIHGMKPVQTECWRAS